MMRTTFFYHAILESKALDKEYERIGADETMRLARSGADVPMAQLAALAEASARTQRHLKAYKLFMKYHDIIAREH
jgi:hypothetical protein